MRHSRRAGELEDPRLPPAWSQLAIEPLPAPMSDETTATWMLGRPPGRFSSRCMSTGKFRLRLSCDSRIDDESSTRNSRSTLRLVAKYSVGRCGPASGSGSVLAGRGGRGQALRAATAIMAPQRCRPDQRMADTALMRTSRCP